MGGLVAGALVFAACSSSTSESAGAAGTGAVDTGAADGTGAWERVNMGFVSAYVLVRSGEVVIVDTGPSGDEQALTDTLTALGVGWGDVSDVILTHRHPDHVGNLGSVVDLAPQAMLSTGAGDVDAIGADLGLRGLADGDTVSGLAVIGTPGHTEGHISLLDGDRGVLLAGDALNGADGGVTGPNPDFTPDLVMANASVQRLAGFDYETILFGHGEPVTADGATLVGQLADGLVGS